MPSSQSNKLSEINNSEYDVQEFNFKSNSDGQKMI